MKTYGEVGTTKTSITEEDVEIFKALLMAVDPDQDGEKARVWIPNKSGHDFSASKKYGTPEYITTGLVNRFAVGQMARKWMACLLRSSPKDYVLITSLTILTVVGAAIFGYLHGRINLLVFRNNKYVARTIIFDQLKSAIEEEQKEALL